MNNLSDVLVTTFDNVFSRFGQNAPLKSVLDQIRTGQWREQIVRCRNEVSTGNLEGYKKIKSTLPAITFCGKFEGGHKIGDLVQYNYLLVIDVDDVALEEIPRIRELLSNDIFIYAVWISPSGRGLKGLIKLESPVEYHKMAFDQIATYFAEKYNVDLDKSGSDVSRLCYVSWDNSLHVNEASSIFSFNPITKDGNRNLQGKQNFNLPEEASFKQVVNSQKALYFKTEGRNNAQDRIIIQNIIKFLSKRSLSITESHSDWLRVGLAIAATFTFDIGESYFLRLCRLDSENHSEQKSKDLIDYCYRNRKSGGPNFATIIFLASQKGFKR